MLTFIRQQELRTASIPGQSKFKSLMQNSNQAMTATGIGKMYSNITGLSLGVSVPFAATELEKQTRQSTPKLWRSRTLVSPRGWSFCKFIFKFLSILHARIRKRLYSESLKREVRTLFKLEKSVACSFRRLNGFYILPSFFISNQIRLIKYMIYHDIS